MPDVAASRKQQILKAGRALNATNDSNFVYRRLATSIPPAIFEEAPRGLRRGAGSPSAPEIHFVPGKYGLPRSHFEVSNRVPGAAALDVHHMG
jgi:hypothetical protein